MRKIFEKVDYTNESEAPMIIGMKILKKIEKDWGANSDVYYEIEDILIDLGSDNPKRLALALKRELTNYDLWEAPYKGLVKKIEKWVKPTGKVNEGYEVKKDEDYLDKFLNICKEYDDDKITLYFEDVDSPMIEKRFGDRFKKYLRTHNDEDIEYKAVFHTKNSGYGNRNVCVLYAVEYGGYGYSSTPLCELSFEEFDRLFRNFKLNGGLFRRNDTFMYESNKPMGKPLFRTPVKFVKTYKDEVYEILDNMINDGLVDYSDLDDIYNSRDIEDEIVERIAIITNYSHSDGTKRYILDLIGQYYEEAYQRHLEDDMVVENEEEKTQKKQTNNFYKDYHNKDNKNKDNKNKKQKSSKIKGAIAGAAAAATYLGKKFIYDPISKSLE